MNTPPAGSRRATDPPPLRRLLGRLVLALLLPSTVAMAAVLWLGARKEEARVLAQLASVAANAGRPLSQQMNAARFAMEDLSRQAAVLHGHDDLQLQRLMQATVSQNELSGLYLVSRDGIVLTNTFAPIGTAFAPVREPELLSSLSTGLTRITDLFVGPISTMQLIGITVPVVVEGEVRYTLNAGITLERLHAWLARQAVPEDWSLLLIDRRGAVLAHVGAGSQVPGTQALDAAMSGRGRFPTVVHKDLDLDGEPAFSMLRTSSTLGWTIMVQAPRSSILMALAKDMLLALLALGSIALIGLHQAGAIGTRIAGGIEGLGDHSGVPGPVPAFREAKELQERLRRAASDADNARKAELQARELLDSAHAQFEQRLLGELERRVADIARELHDVIGSSLAGIGLLIASAKTRPEIVTTQWLDRFLGEVQQTAELTRRLARGILPVGSASGAFAQSMEELAAHWDGLGSLRCSIDIEGEFNDVSSEAGNQVWRIAQEAMSNAVRHGYAREVLMFMMRSGNRCELRIVDDGVGLPPGTFAGMGMRSMRLRAQMLGGTVEWAEAPGGGCEVVLQWDSGVTSPTE